MELWGTREQGEQWLRRESDKGHIERIGSVQRLSRWENVYARNWRPKKLLHDNILADLVIYMAPDSFTCQQVDRRIAPDAELWFDGKLFYAELHRCKGQTVAELKADRFPEYALIQEPVIWVIEGPAEDDERHRMEAMIDAGQGMRNPYFITFTDLVHADGRMVDKDRQPSELP